MAYRFFILHGHTRATSSSATTIDLIFTTSPATTKSCETIPPIGTSDHYGILSKFSLQSGRPSPLAPRRIWRYKLADFELGNDMLSELDPTEIIVEDDVNASWNNNWSNEFLKIMELCVPHGRFPGRKNLPWLSKSIIQLIRKRNFYFRKSKTSSFYCQKYRRVRNKVVSLLRDSKKKYFKNLNPRKKECWKANKSLAHTTSEFQLSNHLIL